MLPPDLLASFATVVRGIQSTRYTQRELFRPMMGGAAKLLATSTLQSHLALSSFTIIVRLFVSYEPIRI